MDIRMDDPTFPRFVLRLAIAVAVLALFSIAFVVVVDPYRIYQAVTIPGFSRLRPAPEHYQQEIKLTLARKENANVYIMGNSRAESGFNPLELAAPGAVPYNLAISGSDIRASKEESDYLHDIGHAPRKLILGADFLDFLIDPAAPAAKPAGRPHRRDAPDGLKWKFDAMFSLTSLSDALTTLLIQQGYETQTITPEGFNPMQEYMKYAREEGYYAIFRQRAEEYARAFVRKPHGLRRGDTGSSPQLDILRSMIAQAAADRTELQIVIYPYHAQMLAMFERAGLWPAFEEWKGLLAQEVYAAQRKNPDARIALWDFSGFSAFQCEPIPRKNDRTSVPRWYWEAGHFKQALGDLVLARLAHQKMPLSPDRFGFRLKPDNLPENRQRIAGERAACLASAPQIFAEAYALVAQAGRQSH
jgi:hypothetical protein